MLEYHPGNYHITHRANRKRILPLASPIFKFLYDLLTWQIVSHQLETV